MVIPVKTTTARQNLSIYQLLTIFLAASKSLGTYKKIRTAGMVSTPPSRKKAPGMVSMVAAYTAEYMGPYTKGMRASHTPNREFTLPAQKVHCDITI